MIQCIEKVKGNIKFNQYTLFLSDVQDMNELEYWEERLEKLEEPYAIMFYLKKGRIRYNLYCNVHRKDGAFR